MGMLICLILSPKHGIAIIKIFQMVDYFLYFNADTPANLAGFLQIFSETPLDWIPNPWHWNRNEKVGNCAPAKKFEENDLSCYILANVGHYFLQILIIMVLKIIARLINNSSDNDISDTGVWKKVSRWYDNTINVYFISGFLDSSCLDVYMGVFLNVSAWGHSEVASTYEVMNVMVSGFMFILYMWMTLTALYISTRVHSVPIEELEPGYVKYYKSWWWMKEGVKQNSVFARHHYAIMYAKDPLLAALLVFTHDTPHLQIGGICFLNGYFMLHFAKWKPFKDKNQNRVEVINYGLFFVASGIFILLTLVWLEFSEKFKYMYVSNAIIISLIFILIFNFVIIGRQIWQAAKEAF